MFNPRGLSRPIGFCAFLFVGCLLLGGLATASPFITLSKKSGPPTSQILVSGRGFEPNVGVDIFFDTKEKALVVTNGKGDFREAGIYAPRSASPGEHWITALERNSDRGSQAPFLVRTNWSQFQFSPDHVGLNPYENVLNSRTVSSLGLKWSYTTGGFVTSSPTVWNNVVYVGSNDNNIYALNASTGSLLWSYPTRDPVEGSPAVANGVVYAGSNDGTVYALKASRRRAHLARSIWRRCLRRVGGYKGLRAQRQHRLYAVELRHRWLCGISARRSGRSGLFRLRR
jgi:hypothetical protein